MFPQENTFSSCSDGLERSRRANWKHKAERSRVRAAILALRYLRMLGQ